MRTRASDHFHHRVHLSSNLEARHPGTNLLQAGASTRLTNGRRHERRRTCLAKFRPVCVSQKLGGEVGPTHVVGRQPPPGGVIPHRAAASQVVQEELRSATATSLDQGALWRLPVGKKSLDEGGVIGPGTGGCSVQESQETRLPACEPDSSACLPTQCSSFRSRHLPGTGSVDQVGHHAPSLIACH